MEILPNDPGPIYAETQMGRFPVEPWNTVSNFIFLAIILYYVIRLRSELKHYPVLVFSLLLLTVGFVGGSLYHSTRSHVLWFALDWVTILVLALIAGLYFWQQLFSNWTKTLRAVCLFLGLAKLIELAPGMPKDMKVSASYCILALSILLPALLHCLRVNRSDYFNLVCFLVAFAMAVFCRQMDMSVVNALLPLESHFLWHLFGGTSTFFLFHYIYCSEKLFADKKYIFV